MDAPQQSGMADLAARLTKQLADANSNGNLVFSPLSIYAVLALLAAGARGDTLDEVLRVLGARSRRDLEDTVARLLDGPLRDRSESGGPSVAFAYGVWSDLTRPLKPAYRDAVVGTYKAEASVVDFRHNPGEAASKIEEWAANATRNLIDSAVPVGGIDQDTRLVMANAVYFRGKWDLPFYESSTRKMPFYRLDGTAVDVPFMKNNRSHYVAEHDGFKVLKLRYKSPKLGPHHCMCIFLPDAVDGLGSLMDQITSSPEFVSKHLPYRSVELGKFGVPKFKLSFESTVTGVLKDLGIRLPFTSEGDMSDMLEDDGSGLPFLLQDVFQKAVVEVNEEGTRAAAVTTMYATAPTCAPFRPRLVDFVADHPFAYFIMEEASDAILFAGHVVDPSNGAGEAIASPAPFQQQLSTTKRKFDEVCQPPYYPGSSPVYTPVVTPYDATSPLYQSVCQALHVYNPEDIPSSTPYNPTSAVYQPVRQPLHVHKPAATPPASTYSPVYYGPPQPQVTNLVLEYGPYQKQPPPWLAKQISAARIPRATSPAPTGEDESPAESKE